MKKFTTKERSNGELACRYLSEKASYILNITTPVTVWEYLDVPDDVDLNAPGVFSDNYKKYAMDFAQTYTEDLTFEELDNLLCEYADDFAEFEAEEEEEEE